MDSYRSGQFTDALYPIMDGVGSVALNYARELTKRDISSYVFGPQVPGFHETDSQVVRFPSLPVPFNKPWRIGITGVDSFRNRLEDLHLDIVHAHSPFAAGHEALRFAREQRLPVVATFHSKYREDFIRAVRVQRIADSMIRRVVDFYEEVDEVWVPNDLTGETLRSYGFKGSFRIAENGTDIRVLTEEQKADMRQEIEKRHKLKRGVLTLLFVGQHRFEKNTALIIETLHALDLKHIPFNALFVGSGPDSQKMEQLVASYRLEESVMFIGSIFDREELTRYYAAADLFLFPSLYDNAALTIREAAACLVPTIAVRKATTARGLHDGENAFLIENRVDSFLSLLLFLNEQREKIARVGIEASRTVSISWEKIIGEVDSRYRYLIERNRTVM